MGTKPRPACNGTGQSSDPFNAHCLGCGGTGEIDTPDRDRPPGGG
jgi:hypothetical protein